MYLDTEMPCLPDEALSGRIVIRNNGDDAIKLMARSDFPEMFVYFQLFLFPNVSVQEEERITARPAQSPHLRERIKKGIDTVVEKNENIVTLKKGEALEVDFEGVEIKMPHGAGNRQMPFTMELYLSPDTWIPVEVCPPIVVASGITYTSLTATEVGLKWDANATRAYRAKIGTNEFLLVREKIKHYRLADLHPDDVVTHTNNTITITQKDGNVRTIPEKDIPRISAERKEEKRKNRPKE